ncbi:MAG TPA: alpha/beta hydrolase [Jatrophihabitantaceae bacterium]|nr:alpha/beta hydrolase [Jatrophihabitantaceae bacterium]
MTTRTVQLPSGHQLAVWDVGTGMPVIMCHGFPGLGFSFRHQLEPIAEAGFRAVAPDMLGYGGSSAPTDPAEYEHARTTDDLLALLDELGAERAVFVGHDFGAPAAWNVAVRAPHRVAGLVLLSVPYDPVRLPIPPTALYAHAAEGHFLHTHYFQQPGVADRELASDPRTFLARLFYALSGAYHYVDIWRPDSVGKGYLDVLPEAPPLPWSWLSEDEFEHYVAEFTRTGFTGGLNWYRALDLNWQRDAEYADRPIEVPTMFVAGDIEPVLQVLGKGALDRMWNWVPDLRGVHLLEGAGHWVQQECADEVNALLVDFLRRLPT